MKNDSIMTTIAQSQDPDRKIDSAAGICLHQGRCQSIRRVAGPVHAEFHQY